MTRGAIANLNRDELQGVIAHEFSHIIHGDMRLNIRLTGIIFGIMAIGFIGYVLFRFIAPAMLYSGRGRDKNGAAIGMAIFGAGIALMIIGGLGTLFSRLIQAGVSRQREFLADASAVDYTRNPSGIAGALAKIGGLKTNTLKQAAASEFQHFFFTSALNTMMATHPPLAERINRIKNREVVQDTGEEDVAAPTQGLHAAAAGFAAGGAASGRNLEMREASQVRESMSHYGDADPVHLAYARAILAFIPEKIRDAVHEPLGAQATCLLILVDKDSRVSGRQGGVIEEHASDALKMELMRLKSDVISAAERSPELRLVLADMAMPALSRMPEDSVDPFMAMIEGMIHADGRLERFEWLLGRLLVRHLRNRAPGGHAGPPPRRALGTLSEEVRTILAMLAWSGARSEEEATQSFRTSAGRAGIGNLDLPGREDCSVEALDKALDALSRLRFRDRGVLLDAAADGVCADGQVTLAEVEMLRGLAAALDCPMPPVLPGKVAAPTPQKVALKK